MRQRIRSSIVALVVLVLLASTASAAVSTQALAQNESIDDEQSADSATGAATDDWPTYRADDGRTGATAADGAAPYGQVTWDDTFSGEPVDGPTVVDGTAYLAVETQLEYYKKAGAVAAYDAASGTVQWQRTGLGAPRGSPTVVDGTVYVATEGADPDQDWAKDEDGDGGLYALDAATGETEWVRNETEFWLDAPVYHDGVLYTVRKPAPDEAGNTSLVAIEPDTGETRWSVEADSLAGAADGTVYGHHDGDLFAVDTENGERTWSVEASTVGDYTYPERLAVANDAIYAVHEGPDGSMRAAAYATADGAALWNVTVADDYTPLFRPAVTDDGVYLTAREDNEIVRLDAETGAESWRYAPQDGLLAGGPTVANDTVFVGSLTLKETEEPEEGYRGRKHTVMAVDARNGSQRWGYVTDAQQTRSPSERVVAPSVADGSVYVSSHGSGMYPQESTGYLHALEASATEPAEENTPSDGFYEERGPRLDASISVTETDPDEEFGNAKNVTLEARADSVRAGNVTSYEWDVDGDGTFESTGGEVSVTLEECQFTTVTLRVTTDEGETATDSVTLSNT